MALRHTALISGLVLALMVALTVSVSAQEEEKQESVLLRYSADPLAHTHLISFQSGEQGADTLRKQEIFSVTTLQTSPKDGMIEAELVTMGHTVSLTELGRYGHTQYNGRGQMMGKANEAIAGTADSPDYLIGLAYPLPVLGFPWLPDEPVAPGEEWTENWHVQQLDMSGQAKPFVITVEYAFEGITTVMKRRCAEIVFEGKGQQRRADGVLHEVRMEGTWVFDMEAGCDAYLRLLLHQQWTKGNDKPEKSSLQIEKLLSASVVLPKDWDQIKAGIERKKQEREDAERKAAAEKAAELRKWRTEYMRWTTDESAHTRASGYLRLARMGYDNVCETFVNGLEQEKNRGVLAAAAVASGLAECEDALPRILELLGDDKPLERRVFRFHTKALRTAENADKVDHLYQPRMCEVAAWAIQEITGKDYGFVACYESRDDMPEIIERIRKDYPEEIGTNEQ